MKYKVGDKVRIKSKEWFDARSRNIKNCASSGVYNLIANMAGKIVTVKEVKAKLGIYGVKEAPALFTEEMIEGLVEDKPALSESLLQDIANVIKNHNMGVQVSESDGKLIIEPLKAEYEDDLPIDTPCMCGSSDNELWGLRYYASKGKVYSKGLISPINEGVTSFEYIIPFDKFDPDDIKESLKYNVVK